MCRKQILWIESFAQLLASRHEGEAGDAAFETVACVFERLASKSFQSTIKSFSSECLGRYHDALDKLLRLTVEKAGKNVVAWRCACSIFVCDYRSETWLDRIGLLIDPLCKKYEFYRQDQKCNVKTCDAIVSCLTCLVEEMLSRSGDDEDVDHVNTILISVSSQLLMDNKKKSKTKKINSKKKTRRLHEKLTVQPQYLDFLHGTLSDFVVLMAQYRFDTIMIHVVLPLLRHRSSRETHAISNQLYFGLRVMCRIFEHVSSSSNQAAFFPACNRDDDRNVLSRAVRIYWDDIEAEMCRAMSATLAAVMGWDDGEMLGKTQSDLECDVARELLKCLHLFWPISQRLSRSRIVRFASRCALIRNQEKIGLIDTARQWLRGAIQAGGTYPELYREVCSVSGMIGDLSKVIETLLSKEEDVDVIEFDTTLLTFEDGTSVQYLQSPWEKEKTGYHTSSNLVVSVDHWARAQGIRVGSRISTCSAVRTKKKARRRVIKGMNLLLDFLSVCMSVSRDKVEDSIDILRNVEAVGTVLLCSNYGIERMLAVDVLRNVHALRPRLSVYVVI